MAHIKVSDVTEIQLAPTVQEVECIRNVAMPDNFFACIPDVSAVAIRSTVKAAHGLTYQGLREFICGVGNLNAQEIGPRDVVGIVMANGPELALALIVCTCQCATAPLEPNLSHGEFVAAFKQMNVKHVISLQQQLKHQGNYNVLEQACADVACRLHFVSRSHGEAGLFRWDARPKVSLTPAPPHFLHSKETALLLRTSGTTSRPKLVPLTPEGLYTGAVCMGRGLDLTTSDVALNVMPYTHIGGISCSLFATLFAGGGSVICATAFEPASFLAWLEELRPTWYYAAPTIHKALILSASSMPLPLQHSLRLIRSGAAHLAHADAKMLQEIFKCKVLPTYSMSECMPIAQPLLSYDLSKPGAVGVPIAASMRIADEAGKACDFEKIGEVCITGPVVTSGYLDDEEANSACFFGEASSKEHLWFRTGDVGYLDQDACLFLTGRSKELIKRGGEQVSPYEVEEVLISHPDVQLAIVFGVPNDFWGEEVAAAVVLKHPEQGMPEQLIQFAGKSLPNNKVPQQVIILDSTQQLPKTRTGKYIRTGLANHLGAQPVDLAAATGLAGNPTTSQEERVAKPHKAIYGLRYIFAVWVVFVHFGPSNPTWLAVWKSYSFSMPGYFILAGFLLSSSTSEPVNSKFQFYRNRIIAAHPLYLLSVLYSIPLTLMMCPPGRTGISPEFTSNCGMLNTGLSPPNYVFPGSYGMQMLYILAVVVFGQCAWPWGIPAMYLGFMNGVLWFSSAYYFCLLCFPFFYDWMNSRCLLGRNATRYVLKPYCIRYLLTFLVFWLVGFCVSFLGWNLVPAPINWLAQFIQNPVVRSMFKSTGGSLQGVAGMFSYSFPVTWAFMFFLGMVMCKLFELNRSRPDAYRWPYWGTLTDLTTLFMVIILVVASLLWVFQGHFTYIEYMGHKYPQAAGIVLDIAQWWGGDAPAKFVTSALCLWIYGLAVGDGFSAKVFGNRFLVQYLSPAAYSVYLFHFPTAEYYSMFKVKVLRTRAVAGVGQDSGNAGLAILDYFVIVSVSTMVAMLAAHKLNAPLTSMFMRVFDCLCICVRTESTEDESTLEKVAAAVRGLSGAVVNEKTPIAECGLDSFGTSALLGMLKPKFRGLRLTPLEIYRLETIGDLVTRIDSELCDDQCARTLNLQDQMRAPLAEAADSAV